MSFGKVMPTIIQLIRLRHYEHCLFNFFPICNSFTTLGQEKECRCCSWLRCSKKWRVQRFHTRLYLEERETSLPCMLTPKWPRKNWVGKHNTLSMLCVSDYVIYILLYTCNKYSLNPHLRHLIFLIGEYLIILCKSCRVTILPLGLGKQFWWSSAELLNFFYPQPDFT